MRARPSAAPTSRSRSPPYAVASSSYAASSEDARGLFDTNLITSDVDLPLAELCNITVPSRDAPLFEHAADALSSNLVSGDFKMRNSSPPLTSEINLSDTSATAEKVNSGDDGKIQDLPLQCQLGQERDSSRTGGNCWRRTGLACGRY